MGEEENPLPLPKRILVRGVKMATDRYCIDCKYYQGNNESILTCCYIFIEDKKRPCDPGKDCTVKVKRRRKRKGISDGK